MCLAHVGHERWITSVAIARRESCGLAFETADIVFVKASASLLSASALASGGVAASVFSASTTA